MSLLREATCILQSRLQGTCHFGAQERSVSCRDHGLGVCGQVVLVAPTHMTWAPLQEGTEQGGVLPPKVLQPRMGG